uniref:Activin_recp domain-containing protein n=1 Tax=Steinernema glaseri TaxID=37863 RepID=A0A1I7Z4P0_9BILA
MKATFVVGIAVLVALPLFVAALKCHVYEHSPMREMKEDPKTDECVGGDKYCVSVTGQYKNGTTIVLDACESSSILADYGFFPPTICAHDLSYFTPNNLTQTQLKVVCCTGDDCNSAVLARVSSMLFFCYAMLSHTARMKR